MRIGDWSSDVGSSDLVGRGGQQWTTLEALRDTHRNRVEPEAEGLLGIGTEPGFAIGQRALLVRSPGGNLLWDCIALVDDDTVARVREAGGIRAIAISHPPIGRASCRERVCQSV